MDVKFSSKRRLILIAIGSSDRISMPSNFFLSLKTERTACKVYKTMDHAKADGFDYTERSYNPKCSHSTLGYLSPMELENKMGLA